jgi:hypothetical protein
MQVLPRLKCLVRTSERRCTSRIKQGEDCLDFTVLTDTISSATQVMKVDAKKQQLHFLKGYWF